MAHKADICWKSCKIKKHKKISKKKMPNESLSWKRCDLRIKVIITFFLQHAMDTKDGGEGWIETMKEKDGSKNEGEGWRKRVDWKGEGEGWSRRMNWKVWGEGWIERLD